MTILLFAFTYKTYYVVNCFITRYFQQYSETLNILRELKVRRNIIILSYADDNFIGSLKIVYKPFCIQ